MTDKGRERGLENENGMELIPPNNYSMLHGTSGQGVFIIVLSVGGGHVHYTLLEEGAVSFGVLYP